MEPIQKIRQTIEHDDKKIPEINSAGWIIARSRLQKNFEIKQKEEQWLKGFLYEITSIVK